MGFKLLQRQFSQVEKPRNLMCLQMVLLCNLGPLLFVRKLAMEISEESVITGLIGNFRDIRIDS